MKMITLPMAAAILISLGAPIGAQSSMQQGMGAMDHANMGTQGGGNGQMGMKGQMMGAMQMQGAGQMPTEPGQSAFAAIAEIVQILRADADTDWDRVNIDALRLHLVDMDAVTLRAQAVTTDVEGGAAFDVISSDPRVTQAIRAMVIGHAQTMSGVDGLTIQANEIADGARMVVTGDNVAMIRGLGFFGVLGLGNHHQPHHIALARGEIAPRG